MTVKHMETQREITWSWIFHLISEWPKIALSVPNTGSRFESLHVCARQHWKQTLKTSYWLCPNIQKSSIYAATESNTQTQVLQMHTVGAVEFLVCFPSNTYHLFYFRGNLVWAKPQGDRTEGEIEQFPLCCILTYEVVHRQGKRAPLRITVLIPKKPAKYLKAACSLFLCGFVVLSLLHLDLLLIVMRQLC